MGFQSKNRKIFTMGAVRIKFVAPFSELCLPCHPLLANLNHFHKHSNISYGDLFGMGIRVRGVEAGAGAGAGGVGRRSVIDRTIASLILV